MAYAYATHRRDNTDLASGFVLRSSPGHPAFPVRLASETFQRALAEVARKRVTVWDPCCGSGYLLTAVALLHRERIAGVVASDIDADALELARHNLNLLDPAGMTARAEVLQNKGFGKESHAAAAEAAYRMAGAMDDGSPMRTIGRADVFDAEALRELVQDNPPDIVLTDLPYGEQSQWRGPGATDASPARVVRTLAAVLPPHAIVAVCVRARKVPVDRAAARFRVGNRAIALVRV